MILSRNGLSGFLKNIQHPHSISLLKNFTWALSNLCRGKPAPSLESIAPSLPFLSQLVQQFGVQLASSPSSPPPASGAKDIVIDASWALSYISDGDVPRIASVLSSGVLPHLVSLLALADSVSVVTPVLRTLGNFVSGNDEQTQAVVDAGGLEHCPRLLCCEKKQVKRETLWLLSNVLAGPTRQVEAVFNVKTAGRGLGMEHLVKKVVDMAREESWEVRKEGVWCVCNICTGGSDMHSK